MSKVEGRRSIVITGGNGFVGRWLQEELKREWHGAQVTSWDLPEVDITQPETYRDKLQELQPEWLVHLAAISSVPASFKDPELTRRVNVGASQNILRAVAELSPNTKVLAISTADIYNGDSPTPLSELPLAQTVPKSPYAKSKWEMEKIIEESFNDRTIRVRPFPHIGPGQRLGFVTADFASQIAAIEAGRQEPVMKVGNLEAARDFTDVRDVVRAYRLLMEKGQVGEVYHVASGKAVQIQTVLEELISFSSVDIAVEVDADRLRPSDVSVLVGNTEKLQAITGWQPTISLEQSLQDILEWWRQVVEV